MELRHYLQHERFTRTRHASILRAAELSPGDGVELCTLEKYVGLPLRDVLRRVGVRWQLFAELGERFSPTACRQLEEEINRQRIKEEREFQLEQQRLKEMLADHEQERIRRRQGLQTQQEQLNQNQILQS